MEIREIFFLNIKKRKNMRAQSVKLKTEKKRKKINQN